MSPIELAAAKLVSRREELDQRLEKVCRDLRHVAAPLSADSADRSVELEDDEVLNRLAETTCNELTQVRHALNRIDAGHFGVCEQCGDPVGVGRLLAVPEATDCAACACVTV